MHPPEGARTVSLTPRFFKLLANVHLLAAEVIVLGGPLYLTVQVELSVLIINLKASASTSCKSGRK